MHCFAKKNPNKKQKTKYSKVFTGSVSTTVVSKGSTLHQSIPHTLCCCYGILYFSISIKKHQQLCVKSGICSDSDILKFTLWCHWDVQLRMAPLEKQCL